MSLRKTCCRVMAALAISVMIPALCIGAPALAKSDAQNVSWPWSKSPGEKTSSDMLKSDTDAASSVYRLELAKADNIKDQKKREDAQKKADNNQNDAIDLANQQYDARQAIIKRIGGDAYDPSIKASNFVSKISNPYFPLVPGTTFVYEGTVDGNSEHVEVTVTTGTKVILGVTCVVVRDTSLLDGELAEDTYDWYAQDKNDNVWYFGENAKQYADGEVVGLEGSWKAGVDGAKPGIIMKASPKKGDMYRQEFALGETEDMSEILALGTTATVPAGIYTNCLKTKDFSPIEPDTVENKYFAKGTGQVLTIDKTTGEREQLVKILHE